MNECLWKGSQAIKLRPKAFAVLEYLLGRAGQLVTKENPIGAVWPDSFVGDAVLKVAIREVREDCFQQSFAIVRRQGALSLGLRAAASLARLHRRRGRHDLARSVVAPIYEMFAEDSTRRTCATPEPWWSRAAPVTAPFMVFSTADNGTAVRHPSQAARATRSTPPATATVPMTRATTPPTGASRSTVMAAVTAAITLRSITPMTS